MERGFGEGAAGTAVCGKGEGACLMVLSSKTGFEVAAEDTKTAPRMLPNPN